MAYINKEVLSINNNETNRINLTSINCKSFVIRSRSWSETHFVSRNREMNAIS